jgi:S-phase kinase-associated protein 1
MNPDRPPLLPGEDPDDPWSPFERARATGNLEERVVLVSNDDMRFELPRYVACLSKTVSDCLGYNPGMGDDVVMGGAGPVSEEVPEVPLPNVDGKTLAKIVEWCTHHAKLRPRQQISKPFFCEFSVDDIIPWDEEFTKNLDRKELVCLMTASNYMHVKMLTDLCCKVAAIRCRGKKLKDLQDFLELENDFTPEEAEQVNRENQWCLNVG